MVSDNETQDRIVNLELELLLQAIQQQYDYDFREYSRAHVKRRVLHYLNANGIPHISELQHRLLTDEQCFRKLLKELSINVTEMFRNPSFYKTIREKVVGLLKTYPFLKIWHAGCATGEEVYSFAILLKEEGLYDRTQIYATDFNGDVIKKAKTGSFSIRNIRDYTSNYQQSGGKESFSDYYHATDNRVLFDKSLSKNIVFAEHNLVSDGVFSEVNMVISRNVLIYFNRELQNRVLNLMDRSLVTGGFLGLGSKETIMFSDIAAKYKAVDSKERIFKKIHV